MQRYLVVRTDDFASLLGLTTDQAIADAIGRDPSLVSRVRHGRVLASNRHLAHCLDVLMTHRNMTLGEAAEAILTLIRTSDTKDSE